MESLHGQALDLTTVMVAVIVMTTTVIIVRIVVKVVTVVKSSIIMVVIVAIVVIATLASRPCGARCPHNQPRPAVQRVCCECDRQQFPPRI